jgi:hypothetical protein
MVHAYHHALAVPVAGRQTRSTPARVKESVARTAHAPAASADVTWISCRWLGADHDDVTLA